MVFRAQWLILHPESMKTIQEIKEMLFRSEGQEALEAANEIVENKGVDRDMLANAYYPRGNAYRQQGNVRMALNSYLESMELDPDGPAAEAYRHIQELLDFYNKDYYNP